MPLRNAFTLIELLVVITIIVVLLALLTPALDRAIYQAELAVCGANMRAIGVGATSYATAYRRYYPSVEEGGEQKRGEEQNLIANPFNEYDFRPILREFLSINGHLSDPLSGEVNLETTHESSLVYSAQYLWFGGRFEREGFRGQGMDKIGSKFSWSWDYDGDGEETRYRFNLLATDWDTNSPDAPHAYASHPDTDGVMSNIITQDSDTVALLGGPDTGASSIRYTGANWNTTATHMRGPVDFNFAADDGSVERIATIEFDDFRPNDSRLVQVPRAFNSGEFDGDFSRLPPLN